MGAREKKRFETGKRELKSAKPSLSIAKESWTRREEPSKVKV